MQKHVSTTAPSQNLPPREENIPAVRVCIALRLVLPVELGLEEAEDAGGDVDEFVLGGREKDKIGRSYNAKKKKAITAVELTEGGKVKRMYAMRIEDFSARSLQYILAKF